MAASMLLGVVLWRQTAYSCAVQDTSQNVDLAIVNRQATRYSGKQRRLA